MRVQLARVQPLANMLAAAQGAAGSVTRARHVCARWPATYADYANPVESDQTAIRADTIHGALSLPAPARSAVVRPDVYLCSAPA